MQLCLLRAPCQAHVRIKDQSAWPVTSLIFVLCPLRAGSSVEADICSRSCVNVFTELVAFQIINYQAMTTAIARVRALIIDNFANK